jgi:hypothetical protein
MSRCSILADASCSADGFLDLGVLSCVEPSAACPPSLPEARGSDDLHLSAKLRALALRHMPERLSAGASANSFDPGLPPRQIQLGGTGAAANPFWANRAAAHEAMRGEEEVEAAAAAKVVDTLAWKGAEDLVGDPDGDIDPGGHFFGGATVLDVDGMGGRPTANDDVNRDLTDGLMAHLHRYRQSSAERASFTGLASPSPSQSN